MRRFCTSVLSILSATRKLGSGTSQRRGWTNDGHVRLRLEGVPVMSDDLVPIASLAPQASSDEHLIQLWLDGRSRHTRRVYEADSRAFLAHARCPLRSVTVGEVQSYRATLDHLAPASQARKLSPAQSLPSLARPL